MDKGDFILVLQSSLLAFDGVDIKELCSKYGIPEKLAIAGFNLAKYLKSVNLQEVKHE